MAHCIFNPYTGGGGRLRTLEIPGGGQVFSLGNSRQGGMSSPKWLGNSKGGGKNNAFPGHSFQKLLGNSPVYRLKIQCAIDRVKHAMCEKRLGTLQIFLVQHDQGHNKKGFVVICGMPTHSYAPVI